MYIYIIYILYIIYIIYYIYSFCIDESKKILLKNQKGLLNIY